MITRNEKQQAIARLQQSNILDIELIELDGQNPRDRQIALFLLDAMLKATKSQKSRFILVC